jgi:hypothetical protein
VFELDLLWYMREHDTTLIMNSGGTLTGSKKLLISLTQIAKELAIISLYTSVVYWYLGGYLKNLLPLVDHTIYPCQSMGLL